ncbi:MAG: Calcium-gated potassium channel mthK [Frankiales bacterium]|nr:Calcium-gated potassium channel mthK [Frankiales bacterium]
MNEAAEHLLGHVIVCGLNDVGLRIVEQLQSAGEQVLVIDDGSNPRLTRIVTGLAVLVHTGDARRPDTLRRAGLLGAAALISVADQDLLNLEITLLARELAPDARIVVQLTNAAVGRAVSRLGGAVRVLDTATLAAPSFVEACLNRHEHEIYLDGLTFQVVQRVVEHHAVLRSAFGDLAPLAVIPAAGGPMAVCPGRDLAVEPGDVVTLVGTEDQLAARRMPHEVVTATREVNPGMARLTRIVLAMRGMLGDVERAFWLSVLALVSVGALSVVLLMISYDGPDDKRMGVVDAGYFTVETLTTVGFGDFYFAKQETWLRLWAIGLMIIGATLVTILYARLTDLLITRRMASTAGRRRTARMSGHIVLVGLGAVGLRVLEQLHEANRSVAVLERDANNRYLSAARALNVPVVFGDSTLRSDLQAAGLARAASVAVLTSNDLANIETGLAVDDLLAERRGEVPVVLRVFDRQLAGIVGHSFGFSQVRSTSALAAPWFVGAALGLTILSTFYVEAQPFLVGQLTVTSGGGLAGHPMAELGARIRVIAISRRGSISVKGTADEAGFGGGLEYPPRRDTRFAPGDRAFIVGPYEELLQVLRRERGASGGPVG